MGKRIFQVGQQIHKLILLEYKENAWSVKCQCGNIAKIKSNKLRRSKSCGCLNPFKISINKVDPSIVRVINSYKTHAKERNLVWNLTKEEVKQLFSNKCTYCGLPPNNSCCAYSKDDHRYKDAVLVYNGIDRIDNYRGYELDNVCSCCKICNRAKSDMSHSDFLNWLSQIGVRYGNKSSGDK